MYGLTNKEKLNFIIKKSKELEISPYEYGKIDGLTASGADNILKGKSKNPRSKSLNIMLKYLEEKVLGTNLKEDGKLINEPQATYDSPLEDLIYKKIEAKFNEKFKEIDDKYIKLRKDLKRIHDQIIQPQNNDKKIKNQSNS